MEYVLENAIGRTGAKMIIKNVELETVCGITSKLPDNQLCEIAFCRKSLMLESHH